MTTDLLTLAERCEKAAASEQRALLTEAFFALNPLPDYEPDWNCAGNVFRVWQDRDIAFKRPPETESASLSRSRFTATARSCCCRAT